MGSSPPYAASGNFKRDERTGRDLVREFARVVRRVRGGYDAALTEVRPEAWPVVDVVGAVQDGASVLGDAAVVERSAEVEDAVVGALAGVVAVRVCRVEDPRARVVLGAALVREEEVVDREGLVGEFDGRERRRVYT